MFGNDSLPSRIYQYGTVKQPIQNGELIADQMYQKHVYQNNLVRIEKDRRQAIQEVYYKYSPKIKALVELSVGMKAELAKAEEAMMAERVESGSKKPGPCADKHAEIEARKKSTDKEISGLKAAVRKKRGVKKDFKAVNANFAETARAARAEAIRNGLFWGSYLAAERAAKPPAKKGPDGKKLPPPEPQFKRWGDGTGQIAVQLQHGITVEQALSGEDRRFRLILTGRFGRGGQKRPFAEAWLRVGSTNEPGKRKDPIWAVIPIVMHRPLPEDPDIRIKWVYLNRRRIGTRTVWDLSVVVSKPTEFEIPADKVAKDGVVGLNVGYKKIKTDDGSGRYGLLVADWDGSDGAKGTLVIQPADVERWFDAYAREADRDVVFNHVRDALVEWKKAGETILPDWFKEESQFMSQWRAQRKLARLVYKWRENRFPGDDEGFEMANVWFKEDKKAYNSSAGRLHRAVAWRNEQYKLFVNELRLKYRGVRIKAVDYAAVAAMPAERYVPDEARKNRAIAAPGYLTAVAVAGFPEVERIKTKETRKPRKKK